MKKLISIIVPIYNVEFCLKRCLDSIIAQTYTQWECILVNDGSTDNSLEIAQKYAEKDERFQLFSQENQGLSMARNNGMEKTKGDYLTFLDSDDAIHEECLKQLHQRIIEDNTEVAVCRYIYFDSDIPVPELTDSHEIISGEEAVKRVLVDRQRFMITAWGKLYKRELFNEIRYPARKLHEDEFVTYKIFAQCKKISVIQNQFYFYYQREGSIMSQYKLKRLDILDALRESTDYIHKEIPSLYPDVYVNYLFNLAIAYYRVSTLKNEKEALQDIRQIFEKEWPNYASTYRKNCRGIKKVAIDIFKTAPGIFLLGAKLYLRMNPDD